MSIHDVVLLLRDLRDDLAEVKMTLQGHHKPQMTVGEVAELTGRSSYTVRRWIKEGRIAATRVQGTGPKGRLLISRQAIDSLVRAGMGEHVPGTAIGSSTWMQE
jgi:excisionase family DNA binding protein